MVSGAVSSALAMQVCMSQASRSRQHSRHGANYGLDYAAFAMTLDRDAEHSLRLGNGIRSSYEDSLQQTPCLDDDAVRRFGA